MSITNWDRTVYRSDELHNTQHQELEALAEAVDPQIAALRGVMQASLAKYPGHWIGPNNGTTVGTFPSTVTSVGTVSHPAQTVALPWAVNFVSAGSANATAGTGGSQTAFLRGDGNGLVTGLMFHARFFGPDASYATSRWFAGFTSTTLALTGSEVPASWTGHRVGLYAASDHGTPGRWFIRTRDNTTTTETAIGTRDFAAQKVYDFQMWVPAGAVAGSFRLQNVTDGWTETGAIPALTLPGGTTAMRHGVQFGTPGGVAGNIRIQSMYAEQR